MKAKASVSLAFPSQRQLKALTDALTPELQRQIGTRSKATLTTDAQTLMLNVEAEDTVALRAALNAYLRWINSALSVLEMVEQKS
jgi:KEOPS complex subunit Pcc1